MRLRSKKYSVVCEETTKEAAIKEALEFLKAPIEDVVITEQQSPKKYLFGLIKRNAIVEVTLTSRKIVEIEKEIAIKEQEEKIRHENEIIAKQKKENELIDKQEKVIKDKIIKCYKNCPELIYATLSNIYVYLGITIEGQNNNKIPIELIVEDICTMYRYFDKDNEILSIGCLEKCYDYLFNKYSQYVTMDYSLKELLSPFSRKRRLKQDIMKDLIKLIEGDEIRHHQFICLSSYEYMDNFISNYVEVLAVHCIIVKLFEYKNKIIDDNKEFTKLLNNGITDFHDLDKCEDIYKIYMEYYSESFEYIISFEDFKGILKIYLLTSKYARPCIKSQMEELNLPVIDMNHLEGCHNIFAYIIENHLKTGEFDVIMKYTNKQDILNLIFAYINYESLKYLNLKEWVLECYKEIPLYEKFCLYFKKKLILSGDDNNGRYDLKMQKLFKDAKTGIDFENALYYMYSILGYKVEKTKTTGDQGADLIIIKQGRKSVVQAKYYSNRVGNAAVQQVVGAIKYYNAEKGIVVTNNEFTNSAYELARSNNIKLIDGEDLQVLINSII